MKHRIGFILIAALLTVGGSILNAQHRQGSGEMMKEALKLSDEQAAKMKELRSDHMKSMTDNQASVKKAHIDLRGLMTADKPDRAAIKAKMKEIADLRLEGEYNRIDHMFTVRSMLTPEQQKIMKEKTGKMMRGNEGRGFRRPGRRGSRMGMNHRGMREGMHEGMQERMHEGMAERERMHQ